MRLIGFSYANGSHWCDRDTMQNGEYKRIALIRKSGIIKWDAKKENLPDNVVKHIESAAEKVKVAFLKEWNNTPDIVKYECILDMLPTSEFLDVIKFKNPICDVIKKYENMYFDQY